MKLRAQIAKNILASFLILLFMIPVSFFILPTHSAQAQGEPVFDAANFAQNQAIAVSNGAIKVAEFAIQQATDFLALKEGWLDGLAWILVDITIETVTRDLITWINNGFEGSPAFVTDIRGFFIDIADKTAGEFIRTEFRDGEFAFLCEPFKGQIQIALALSYGGSPEETYCRLSDITTNVENFIEGNFTDGGWRGWLQLSTRDNAYNRYLQAHAALTLQIGDLVREKEYELDWGNGFLSWEQCNEETPGDADQNCEIVTPGSVIEEQLNNTLDFGNRRLTVADEINEVLAALITQLAKQALGGIGGVRGYTSSYAGSTAYFDRPEFNQVPDDLFSTSGTYPVNPATAREYETRIADNIIVLLADLAAVESLITQLAACDVVQGQTWVGIITNQNIRENLETELDRANQNLLIIDEFEQRLAAAQSNEEINPIFDEFQDIAQDGQFHSFEDMVSSDRELETSLPGTLAERLASYQQQIQQAIVLCQTEGGSSGNPINFLNDPGGPGGEGDGPGGPGGEGSDGAGSAPGGESVDI